MAIWTRTQKLCNSFSSDKKKQKAVLPGTEPRASLLASDLSESIHQSAVSVKPQTVHAVGLNVERGAHYGPGNPRKPYNIGAS
jgi:hypothetical protein